MLFYTCRRSPYPYSTRWLDEFDAPALAENLYDSAFSLVDVTVIPDDKIADHRSRAALPLLQKHIHQWDLAELVDRLAPRCCPVFQTSEAVRDRSGVANAGFLALRMSCCTSVMTQTKISLAGLD